MIICIAILWLQVPPRSAGSGAADSTRRYVLDIV